jgi:hypothetical protein
MRGIARLRRDSVSTAELAALEAAGVQIFKRN